MKQDKELADKRLEFDKSRMLQEQRQAEKQLKFQEDAERKQFGLELAKLGITGISSGAFGQIGGLLGFGGDEKSNVIGANVGAKGGPSDPIVQGGGGMFSGGLGKTLGGILGTGISSGLLGYGAGSLLGGDGGFKSGLIGAGVGMIPGLMSGLGSGAFDFGKMGLGALAGGIGGFLS
jgi:hypothetical protein